MENAAFLNDSGIALTEANRPNEAIAMFQRALTLEPENPLLWLNLGIAQQRTGDYDEAMGSFEQAVTIDNNMADAWSSMGLIFYELDLFDSARQCYQNALERDKRSPMSWNNLGVLCFAEGNYEDARHCFEEALIIAPLYYDGLINARDACRELKDYRAAAEYERVLGDFPQEFPNRDTGRVFSLR
ncbi:MAG: tetratricopeptide repeat protein [Treponema sp.]|jgi:Flp pilus assembly protein TadD|nr:tetratricopeptide repeat protein [Treponema sp.]